MRVNEPDTELAQAINEIYVTDLKRTARRNIWFRLLDLLLALVPMVAAGSIFGWAVQRDQWGLCCYAGLVAACSLGAYFRDLYRSR